MRIFTCLFVCCLLLSASSVSAEQVRKGKGPPTKKEVQEQEAAAAEAVKNQKLTMADCKAMGTDNEDYGYCVWEIAEQEKSIYFCAYLDTRQSARECLQSVFKLTKVTPEDCKKMTQHEDVCLDLIGK